MPTSFNPYAAPETTEIRDKPTDDESVRREYLSHEASVQSIGSLYLIGLIITLIAAPIALANSPQVRLDEGLALFLLLVTFTCIVCGGMSYGLLRLQSWARPIGMVLAVLAGIVTLRTLIGPLIALYVIYLLFSRKSRVVFSPDYRRVIAATPHIKYRTSWVVWVFLLLVVLGAGMAIFGWAFA